MPKQVNEVEAILAKYNDKELINHLADRMRNAEIDCDRMMNDNASLDYVFGAYRSAMLRLGAVLTAVNKRMNKDGSSKDVSVML